MNKRKVIPSLRSLADQERATAKKARASWQMFTIMAEFIEATEYLSEIRPAVSIYGFLSIQQPWHKATHSFLAGLAWHNPGGVVSHAPHDLRRRALEVHVRECRPRVPRIDFREHAQHLCPRALRAPGLPCRATLPQRVVQRIERC